MSQFLGNMSTPNFLFDVARGNLEGASAVNLFGFNRAWHLITKRFGTMVVTTSSHQLVLR